MHTKTYYYYSYILKRSKVKVSVIYFGIFENVRIQVHEVCTCEISRLKVIKTARIRNRYTQVPHLSQDTKWERNKITKNITNKSQEVSPFPSSDHKASNEQTRKHDKHKTNVLQKYRSFKLTDIYKVCMCYLVTPPDKSVD